MLALDVHRELQNCRIVYSGRDLSDCIYFEDFDPKMSGMSLHTKYIVYIVQSCINNVV